MRAVPSIPRVTTIEKLIDLINDRLDRIQRETWDAKGQRVTGVGVAREGTDALSLGQAQLLFGGSRAQVIQQISAPAEPIQQIVNNITNTGGGAVFSSLTLTAPSTVVSQAVTDGAFLVLRLIQDATGDRAITYNAGQFETRADVNINAAPNSVTMILFYGEAGEWIQIAPTYQVQE